MNKRVISVLLLLLSLLTAPVITLAASDHGREIDRLVQDKKYLSAAQYIRSRPELMQSDKYLRRYVHILVNYYVSTIQYSMFAMRDLEPNENIADVRGSAGTFEMIGVKIEERMLKRYKKNPESPYLNLAIGEFLSRQSSCGCGSPMHFTGAKAEDYPYFKTAYDAGLRDGWQLFRMGYHHHQASKLKRAIAYYRQSLEAEPNEQVVKYNLAVAYYQNGQDAQARKYAKMALGGYGDTDLDSDTYDLYGSILYDTGDLTEAEKHLRRAMALKNWHQHSFRTLVLMYRKQERQPDYVKLVLDYIANDYANTYLFNRYIDLLSQNGISKYDQKIIDTLSRKKYKTPLETGSVHFNLGRLALARADKKLARKHFTVSLAAMKQVKQPPKDAIEALHGFLKDLEAPI